jgi:heme-degrading monooxygenase HmoA
MIARTWTGWTENTRAGAYEDYMRDVALPGYTDVPGNLGVLMLRRELSDRPWTEFTMISLWRSMADVVAFAGPDPARAVFYDRDDEFLVDRQLTVTHDDVYATSPGLVRDRPPDAG